MPKIRTTTPESGDQVIPSTDTPAEIPKKEHVSPNVQENVLISERNGKMSDVTSMAPPPAVPATVEEPASTHEGSRKHGREEDDNPEGQGSAKKIDTKGGET